MNPTRRSFLARAAAAIAGMIALPKVVKSALKPVEPRPLFQAGRVTRGNRWECRENIVTTSFVATPVAKPEGFYVYQSGSTWHEQDGAIVVTTST